ncbi:MAG: class I SAM-dependent methyltransferase, partial [Nanobdellota archaeon]
ERRFPGQLRLRIRYRKFIGEWMDFLMLSKEELREIVDKSKWRIIEFFDDGSRYVVVLGKG